jgi:hypothetical protein
MIYFVSQWFAWREARGSVVVKALCYKPEGRGSNPDEVIGFFSIDVILPAALGPGVYSASNRNEYQELSK